MKYRTSVSVDDKGQARVEVTGDSGTVIVVYVNHGGDYVSIDAYRRHGHVQQGEPIASMDVDYDDTSAHEEAEHLAELERGYAQDRI